MMQRAELEQEIASLSCDYGFSGVVSLKLPGDELPIEQAFGFAERANGLLNDPETRFAMASGSKLFTAVGVGLLIQEGRLDLNARLLDCVRSRKFHFAADVTIEQLLTHTSGVPDYFDEEVHSDFAELWQDRPCYRMTSITEFLPLFEKAEMTAVPGQRFHYSNSGFILLGLVIEELSGQRFQDFIAERVFQACDMRRTGYYSVDELPENTACGYIPVGEGRWKSNVFSLPSIGGPDGGAFSTVGDLRRFWIGLLEGRLLTPKTLNRFLAPAVRIKPEDDCRHYGHGVWLRKGRLGWIASIVGSDPGVSMVSRARLGDRLILTVFSNHDDGAWEMVKAIDARLKHF